MIRINLLPVRKSRTRENALRQVILGGVGLVLVAGVCGYLYVDLGGKIEDIGRANRQLKAEIEELKQVIGQVEEFEAKKQALEKKLDIIRTLRANKTGPVHMLDEIAINIPEKVWLTSISEVNKKVKMTGMAINNEMIADYISKLEASEYFTDLYLVSTKMTSEKDGLKLKEFAVTARMVNPHEKASASSTDDGAKNEKKGKKG